MGRVQDMVDNVLQEGQFATTAARALAALDSRHKQMVRRSRCYRKTVALGPTVVDLASYTVPDDIVEILELRVDGYPYGNARHVDVQTAVFEPLVLTGSGGVMTRNDSVAGVKQVRLYPVPTTAGDTVDVWAVCTPPTLLTSDDTTVKIPEDYDERLEAGAIGRLMRRLEHRPDLAQPHEQEFADACEELRRQVVREFRGTGPAQIRVIGLNA